MTIEFALVSVDTPADANVIIGQAHFVKTVEGLHEALVGISVHLRFGIAFCEASGDCLIRRSGNDPDLERSACAAAEAIGAGHSFVIMLRGGYPADALNAVKDVPEVSNIWCATADTVGVVVAAAGPNRGIAAVLDGRSPVGIETDADVARRRVLLRELGYKQ
ncbi:adenosine-specific kinase [Actinoplanes sp. NPDC048967]|uniref:adenosine-specific kinase n=1 Tax=Actinoplanes sp. NPDC048967 TaxID=3155269 RepID=UPI0033FCD22C